MRGTWKHSLTPTMRGFALGAAMTLVLASAGIVAASIPGPGGVISGCYGKVGGILRVIDAPSKKCTAIETPLTWSQQGPLGLQGPQGASGTNGKDGTDGTNGTNGTNGTDGTNGKDGADGATGPQGPAGPAGQSTLDGAYCMAGGSSGNVNVTTGPVTIDPSAVGGSAAVSLSCARAPVMSIQWPQPGPGIDSFAGDLATPCQPAANAHCATYAFGAPIGTQEMTVYFSVLPGHIGDPLPSVTCPVDWASKILPIDPQHPKRTCIPTVPITHDGTMTVGP